MITKLMEHDFYVRILRAVRARPMRFTELQRDLGLHPAQVDRALKLLRKGLLVIPHVKLEGEGRLGVKYEIGKRGEAVLRLCTDIVNLARRREASLGNSEVVELQNFFESRHRMVRQGGRGEPSLKKARGPGSSRHTGRSSSRETVHRSRGA